MDKPVISIVIPTYNSEKTLEKVLLSIINQKSIEGKMEILIIDGGSFDNTINIAKKYDTKIYHNDKKLPEYGKLIGFINAKGKYLIKQDSDEEYTNDYQLSKRLELLKENPSVKAVIADRLLPSKNNGICNFYMNCCGDPFTWFVYKKKESIIKTFNKNIVIDKDDKCVMHFAKNDVYPIGDSATTMIDLDWVKNNFSNWNNITFVCSSFNEICKATQLCGIIRNDSIIHHSNGKFNIYLSKLKFRVINNIFNIEESGFSSRYKNNDIYKISFRKYLFVLYSLSIIFPLLDGIRLSIKYKNISMLLHFVFVYYVMFNIFKYYILKILGIDVKNNVYG